MLPAAIVVRAGDAPTVVGGKGAARAIHRQDGARLLPLASRTTVPRGVGRDGRGKAATDAAAARRPPPAPGHPAACNWHPRGRARGEGDAAAPRQDHRGPTAATGQPARGRGPQRSRREARVAQGEALAEGKASQRTRNTERRTHTRLAVGYAPSRPAPRVTIVGRRG